MRYYTDAYGRQIVDRGLGAQAPSSGPTLGGDGRWYAPDGLGGSLVWSGQGWCPLGAVFNTLSWQLPGAVDKSSGFVSSDSPSKCVNRPSGLDPRCQVWKASSNGTLCCQEYMRLAGQQEPACGAGKYVGVTEVTTYDKSTGRTSKKTVYGCCAAGDNYMMTNCVWP